MHIVKALNGKITLYVQGEGGHVPTIFIKHAKIFIIANFLIQFFEFSKSTKSEKVDIW